jgi:hypothetical protein
MSCIIILLLFLNIYEVCVYMYKYVYMYTNIQVYHFFATHYDMLVTFEYELLILFIYSTQLHYKISSVPRSKTFLPLYFLFFVYIYLRRMYMHIYTSIYMYTSLIRLLTQISSIITKYSSQNTPHKNHNRRLNIKIRC